MRFGAPHVIRQWRNGSPGFTLMEVLVATVIISASMWATMTALTTAADIQQRHDGPTFAEANGYALQHIEEVRNMANADDAWFATQKAQGWQTDVTFLPAGGSESIEQPGAPAVRKFCVWEANCDGVGGPEDCYGISVKVCWGASACPADGSSVNVCS